MSYTIPINDHYITLSAAVDMTTAFRTYRETVLATSYQSQNILPFCETFNKSAFEQLLATTGVEALRIYYGMNEEKQLHAIIVAVDENGADILPATSLLGDGEVIVEEGQRCPDLCPPESPLNTDPA